MDDNLKYNPNIHHRRSIRLKEYDYSQAGLFFITICCQYKACLFGEIDVGTGFTTAQMKLNKFGQIAYKEWVKTTEIRNNVALGEFVVMPNHFHCIIQILDRSDLHSPINYLDNLTENHINDASNHPIGDSSDDHIIDVSKKMGKNSSPLRGPSNNIGAIVRGYKAAVTNQLNSLNIGCQVWQRNYYEHIIRDELSYQQISNYIKNNPEKWENDTFYK